jgi:hypothetical protein
MAPEQNFKEELVRVCHPNSRVVNSMDFQSCSINFCSTSFVAPKTLKSILDMEFGVIYLPLSLVMRYQSKL